jgi:ribonuclease HII
MRRLPLAQIRRVSTTGQTVSGSVAFSALRPRSRELSVSLLHLLIDARRIRDVAIPQQPIVKGGCKSLSIVAASILAKTARDALMLRMDGYPVREHRMALKRLGASPIHCRSFTPAPERTGGHIPALPP